MIVSNQEVPVIFIKVKVLSMRIKNWIVISITEKGDNYKLILTYGSSLNTEICQS